RVTLVREDGRVNLAMTQLKQVGPNEDADKLLAFMKERPMGGMPYSDATPPDIIKQRFGISKSAFKRALGKLMKDGLVVQKESWTYLSESAPADQSENK
ncbi:RNA-binding protein, partial [Bacillus velezensis]